MLGIKPQLQHKGGEDVLSFVTTWPGTLTHSKWRTGWLGWTQHGPHRAHEKGSLEVTVDHDGPVVVQSCAGIDSGLGCLVAMVCPDGLDEAMRDSPPPQNLHKDPPLLVLVGGPVSGLSMDSMVWGISLVVACGSAHCWVWKYQLVNLKSWTKLNDVTNALRSHKYDEAVVASGLQII